jgi:hypothetical protein
MSYKKPVFKRDTVTHKTTFALEASTVLALAAILAFNTPTIAGFDENGNWCDKGYDYTVLPYNKWNTNLFPYKDIETSIDKMQQEVDWYRPTSNTTTEVDKT